MYYRSGFTVTEVILFLAITSALTASLLVGTGSAIQQQQYRDSVQSFAAFLQGEYSRVVSVRNEQLDNEKNAKCPIEGVSVESPSPGQSKCLIVGRYITSQDKGESYQAHPVYGLSIGDEWKYGYGNVDQSYNISWGARTRLSDQTDDDAHISILMYRDPVVGSLAIRTSRYSYLSKDIGDFFSGKDQVGETGSDQLGEREVCVYDSGWFPTRRRSVLLSPYSSSSDAITVGNATEGCHDI